MPFPGGLTATANGTLLLSLAAALVYLTLVDRAPSLRRTTIKTLAVLLLAVLSFAEGGPALLTAALVFGAAGDALLARDTERTFLAGLVSFLLAHLAYIALFALAPHETPALLGDGVWRLAALAVLALHVAWLTADMRWPIAAYVAVIAAMGVAALFRMPAMVVAGAALFIASDTILAAERFLTGPASPHRRWIGPVVWITYYAAQALIALAFLV